MNKEDIIQRRKESVGELKNKIAEINPDALFADGYDECLCGYDPEGRACYMADHVIDELRKRDGMSYDDALDFFHFNIGGAYMGEHTPLFLWE